MRSFTLIVLHACIAMTPAKELAVNQNGKDQSFMEKLADKLIDKLIDHVMNMPTDNGDLDGTTLALTQPLASRGARVTPMASRSVTLFNSLPQSACGFAGCRPEVRAEAMRGSSMSASPKTMFQPQFGGMPQFSGMGMSVQSMQDSLRKYGVPPSPLEKLALTQVASTRDPSMKAQVREEFMNLDPATQAKLKRVSKDVIVRASEAAKGESGLELEKMPGVTAPLGLWDPFKLATDIPAGRLYFYREAELKNGRAAMLAIVGIIVSENFRPFWGGSEWVSAVQSHWTDSTVDAKFWPALIIASGFAELFSYPDRSGEPGDLGFDPLGLKPKKEKELLEMQNKELNNGRLAMIAYAGIVGKELMTGVKVF